MSDFRPAPLSPDERTELIDAAYRYGDASTAATQLRLDPRRVMHARAADAALEAELAMVARFHAERLARYARESALQAAEDGKPSAVVAMVRQAAVQSDWVETVAAAVEDQPPETPRVTAEPTAEPTAASTEAEAIASPPTAAVTPTLPKRPSKAERKRQRRLDAARSPGPAGQTTGPYADG